jgi:hypothetical protein
VVQIIVYHNILFIFQTAQAAQRARPNHTIQRITRIPVHNAEMTQSLPGPGCAHSPTPHTALACSKTASLLCWSGCAPHPHQVLPNCCFVLERGTHGLARLAAWCSKLPKSQAPLPAVWQSEEFQFAGSPSNVSKQSQSQSYRYICHSQTRGPLKNRFN